MWYASGLSWVRIGAKWEHTYTIKYASSVDGLRWKRENLTAIQQGDPLECNVRASVIESDGAEVRRFTGVTREDVLSEELNKLL